MHLTEFTFWKSKINTYYVLACTHTLHNHSHNEKQLFHNLVVVCFRILCKKSHIGGFQCCSYILPTKINGAVFSVPAFVVFKKAKSELCRAYAGWLGIGWLVFIARRKLLKIRISGFCTKREDIPNFSLLIIEQSCFWSGRKRM